jgi:hypothetical protein
MGHLRQSRASGAYFMDRKSQHWPKPRDMVVARSRLRSLQAFQAHLGKTNNGISRHWSRRACCGYMDNILGLGRTSPREASPAAQKAHASITEIASPLSAIARIQIDAMSAAMVVASAVETATAVPAR